MSDLKNAALRFAVRADGRPLKMNPARVSAYPYNMVWHGRQRPIDQTEIAWFCTFDMTTPVQVEVEVLDGSAMNDVAIRPVEYGIRFRVDGNRIVFTVPKPMQLSVEVGGVHCALAVFANPVCRKVDPGDPDVLYFGPGEHTAGLILPKSGQTVYLAEGAVVYGSLLVYHADNVTVCGRGILDASPYRRGNDHADGGQEVNNALRALGLTDNGVYYKGVLSAVESRNLSVEGITLRDSQFWAVNVHNNCEYVTIDNIKIIGMWRYNSDGIDICASSHVLVKNCFVRAFDDCLITRPRHLEGDLDKMVDMTVENCVMWCDWGRSIEIWFGGQPAHCSQIVYRNCQLIHLSHIALDVQTWWGSPDGGVDGLLLENIGVETEEGQYVQKIQPDFDTPYDFETGARPRLFVANIIVPGEEWSHLPHRAHSLRMSYDNITVRNIRVHGPFLPESSVESIPDVLTVRNLRFSDIFWNGMPLRDAEALRLRVQPNAEVYLEDAAVLPEE